MISVPWHERVIYPAGMISASQMIYALRMMGTDIISYLRSKYIIRQRRISYRGSDISLKNARFYDIINVQKGGFDMFKWIANLFKPAPDKIEERLLSLFDFLLNTYAFSYSKEELGNAIDKSGKFVFYGPLNAYQFYNENLCINILHLVQRDDYSVYITNKKSADQLFIINGNEIPSDLAYNLPLLAEEFKKAVTNHNVLYGYRF